MSDIEDLDDTTETNMDDHDNITVNKLDGPDDVEQNELTNPQPSTSGFRNNASSKPPPPTTKSAPSEMKIKKVQEYRDETVATTQEEVQNEIDQHTVQPTEADISENDTPTSQEVDELLLDTVEETARAEIRQLDTPSEELLLHRSIHICNNPKHLPQK